MINSGRTGGSARRLRIGFLSAAVARGHGRRDALGLVDLLATAGDGPDPGDDRLPPYVLGIRAQLTRSTTRLRSRLLLGNRELVERIHAESVRVVTQYTVRGEPAPAALARFGRTVGDWRSSAAVCRSRAQGLVDEVNHLLACYWDAAWQRAGRELAGRGLADRVPELPERRPSGWLPGRAELDATWHRLDDGLLSDRWYVKDARGTNSYGPSDPGNAKGGHRLSGNTAPGTPAPAAPAAVEQALAILDSQATYGTPAAAGGGPSPRSGGR
ncbi:hypothetical protein [Streptomyces sp. NPDC007264]|uniref:hypothetical protein n=1 Tax=Streptomyces sp. NPDC007264 TaxID=3364777 RepID=UPI0036DCF4C5